VDWYGYGYGYESGYESGVWLDDKDWTAKFALAQRERETERVCVRTLGGQMPSESGARSETSNRVIYSSKWLQWRSLRALLHARKQAETPDVGNTKEHLDPRA
jgi:hypothetical protein